MIAARAFIMSHESNPDRNAKSVNTIALALTRSLGRQGLEVVRIHPNRLDHSLASKYCSRLEISPNFYESEPAMLAFLHDMAKRYDGRKVLIPASDDSAHFLSRHLDELGTTYAIPVSPTSTMERIEDKKKQYEDALRLRIPIPQTHFPKGPGEIRRLADMLGDYPYIIKPRVAHKWRLASMQGASKGRKAVVVRNAEELVREFGILSKLDPDLMVQEIVKGPDDQLFTFLCYCNDEGEAIAYCVRKKIRQNPIDFGYCTATTSCSNEKVVQQSIRLLREIGYHGLAGVEFKFDEKKDEYKLIEINPRAVNTIGIAPACGVDLAHIMFLDMVGQNVAPVTTWKTGVTWIWSIADISAALQLRRAGRLTMGEWWESVRGRRVEAIFAWDDTKPGIGVFGAAAKRALLRSFATSERAQ